MHCNFVKLPCRISASTHFVYLRSLCNPFCNRSVKGGNPRSVGHANYLTCPWISETPSNTKQGKYSECSHFGMRNSRENRKDLRSANCSAHGMARLPCTGHCLILSNASSPLWSSAEAATGPGWRVTETLRLCWFWNSICFDVFRCCPGLSFVHVWSFVFLYTLKLHGTSRSGLCF